MEYSGTLQPHETQEDDDTQHLKAVETFADRIRDILRPKLAETDEDKEKTTNKNVKKSGVRKNRISKFVSELLFGYGSKKEAEPQPVRKHFPLGIELRNQKEDLPKSPSVENDLTQQNQNYSERFAIPVGDRNETKIAEPDAKTQTYEQTSELPISHNNSPTESRITNQDLNTDLKQEQSTLDDVIKEESKTELKPSLFSGGFVDQLLGRSENESKEKQNNSPENKPDNTPEEQSAGKDKKQQKIVPNDPPGYRVENLYNDTAKFKNSEQQPVINHLETETRSERLQQQSVNPESIKPERSDTHGELKPKMPNGLELDPTEIFKPDLKDKASQLALERAEAAADQDIALETQYERQHEVKDVNSVGQYSGASKSESASNGIPSSSVSMESNASAVKPNKTAPNKHPKSQNPTMGTYKKATTTGLTAGIVLVLVIILFLLLR